MLTEEELEQLVISLIDQKEDDLLMLRTAVEHHNLGAERLSEVYNELKGGGAS